ncbi:MAG TPA: hypothetical protein VGG64_19220 [Pirellulales bacterium]|jgi:hypothetical protein
MDNGLDDPSDVSNALEIGEARKRGRAAGFYWSSTSTRRQRDRVLKACTVDVLGQWIEEGNLTSGASSPGERVHEAAGMLFAAIHGPGVSVAGSRGKALEFFRALQEEGGDIGPSRFLLNFYVGFVEAVVTARIAE